MRHNSDIVPENEYEAWLQQFDHREIDAPDPRSMWALRYRGRITAALAVLATLPGGARILEVGASQGNTSLLAAESGLYAVALDRDTRALHYALKKHTTGAFQPVCGDALTLPFADGVFAGLLGMEILEHLPEPPVALAEMRRVLAPRGLLVVTTPNAQHHSEALPSYTQRTEGLQARVEADGEGHLFAFTVAELRKLLADGGFEVVTARLQGSLLMSDKLPLKRVLPVPLIQRWSNGLPNLPGMAWLGYGCFVVARKV